MSDRSERQYSCEYCSRSFVAYPIHERRFCSRKCCDLAKRQIYSNTNCLACGTIIRYQPHRAKRIYCSKDCQHVHMKYNSSPAWNGGIFTRTRPDGNKIIFWVIGKGNKPYKGHPYGQLLYRTRARVLIENKIRRLLKRTELVWHINGNTLDDSLSNLYVFGSIAEKNKILFGDSYAVPSISNVDNL